MARAVGVIRENAHQAMQDLRDVVGVLRAPTGESPQPGADDIGQLVEESCRAGTQVDLLSDVTGRPPERLGRTAYRIAQEGLTNARVHAPRSPVAVSLTGGPGVGLCVEIRDCGAAPGTDGAGQPFGRGAQLGGGDGDRSGSGLLGLAERVSLLSGRIEHGPLGAGGWRLWAWLPWPL